MRRILTTILLLISFDIMSQGALLVKRFEKPPSGQWFMFSGRRYYGVFIYNGSPQQVENEFFRTLKYYRIDHADIKIPGEASEFDYTVNTLYSISIRISEIDMSDWSRSIYLIVKRNV